VSLFNSYLIHIFRFRSSALQVLCYNSGNGTYHWCASGLFFHRQWSHKHDVSKAHCWTMEKLQIHISDISHVTALSKNYSDNGHYWLHWVANAATNHGDQWRVATQVPGISMLLHSQLVNLPFNRKRRVFVICDVSPNYDRHYTDLHSSARDIPPPTHTHIHTHTHNSLFADGRH
jgi:hypothetical protein